jgi:transcriptional regulator with XRE-family HTH domain
MTVNPLARQRRLGQVLFDLRESLDLTHAELAGKSHVSASVISRLENPFSDIGRKPNLRFVRKLLVALGVERGSPQWAEVERYAEEAADGGWWDRPQFARIGAGQRDYAIVEQGASRIDEYAGLMIPGLAQTQAYARLRIGSAPDADAVLAGRMERQRILDTATYRLVLEEQAVRRLAAPPAVMAEQLGHLVKLAERTNVTVQVLRVDADLDLQPPPRVIFAHIDYPEADDPEIVIVDNVAKAHLVTKTSEVAGYARLHQRLRDAALSDADSVAFIQQAAETLAATV